MTNVVDQFEEWAALNAWHDEKLLSDKHKFALTNSIARLRSGSPTEDEEALASALDRLLSDEPLFDGEVSLLVKRLAALKM